MSDNIEVSIIIPTHNRKEILKRCLKGLFRQSYSLENCEIVVVDDCSTDGTEEVIKSLLTSAPCILRYFKQKTHCGSAVVRNTGIKNSTGKIILFIGDDIIATPTLLAEHIKWHKKYPDDNVAVLGYVTWSPEIKITPFMKYLENGGPQFHFWQIKDQIDIDSYLYFYTSNISLKRDFLIRNNCFFDEEFHFAFEDIEMGYRLKKKGLILKYNKEAVGYHYHYTSLRDYCRRMIQVGKSCPMFVKKTEENDNHLPFNESSSFNRLLSEIKFSIRTVIFYFLYPLAKFYERRKVKAKIFSFVLSQFYLKGIKLYYKKSKSCNTAK